MGSHHLDYKPVGLFSNEVDTVGVWAETPALTGLTPIWTQIKRSLLKRSRNLDSHICMRNQWAFQECFSSRFPGCLLVFCHLFQAWLTRYKIEGFSAVFQRGGVGFLCSPSEISNCITSKWTEVGNAGRWNRYTVRRQPGAGAAMDRHTTQAEMRRSEKADAERLCLPVEDEMGTALVSFYWVFTMCRVTCLTWLLF